jgi:hypothetical protein
MFWTTELHSNAERGNLEAKIPKVKIINKGRMGVGLVLFLEQGSCNKPIKTRISVSEEELHESFKGA